MKPPNPILSKNLLPIDVAFFQLGSSRVATIRHTLGTTDAKTAFSKIQAIAHGAPNAVIIAPLNVTDINASLQDEILSQSAHLVVGKGGYNRGPQSEATAQPSGHIVLPTAFPNLEFTRSSNAAITGIQAQHNLA